jgi:hypothetical protein
MRANWLRRLFLVAAAAGVAGAFALAAAPHEGSETPATALRMPAQTGRSVVDLRPAPGRPESSSEPVLRASAAREAAPKPVAASPRPRPRARVVVVPGVVLTRAEPARPKVKVIRIEPKRTPPPPTRELAGETASEQVHDRPAPIRPHE